MNWKKEPLDKCGHSNRANQYPPYWMAQHNSSGPVSGNLLLSPLHTLQLASHGGQCHQFSLCVVSVVTPWQPCSGLAAWPTEGLPSPQKLHLSSGALQVSERLVRDNPSGHTIRKVSWLLAGIAAAGEDSAHFTALTVLCYILKTFVYPCPEFEEGYHPKRWGWDSSPLPKTLHLQQAEF